MIQLSLEVYYHNREFITVTCVHVRDTFDKPFHTTDVHPPENIYKCPSDQKHRDAKTGSVKTILQGFLLN